MRCYPPSVYCEPQPSAQTSYLQDFLNAIDGGGQQGVHLEVIIGIICMSDAHVKDVCRETRHRARQRLGLQV